MVAVIQCDRCGQVTPGEFGQTARSRSVTPEAREAALRAEGWLLTADRDLCPTCHTPPRAR